MPTSQGPLTNTGDRSNTIPLNYQCEDCENFFYSPFHLEEHKRAHHPPIESGSKTAFKCMVCGRKYKTERMLKKHRRLVHNFEANDTECTICRKIIHKTNLALHMSTEHDQSAYPILAHLLSAIHHSEATTHRVEANQCRTRPFKCVLCGKRTKTAHSMIVHHRRFHGPDCDSETTICRICGKRILSRNIRLHVASVHGYLGEFNCKTCKLSFKSNLTLQKHQRQFHSEVRDSANHHIPEDSPSPRSSVSGDELTPAEREYLFQLFNEHSATSER